jgi:hypothetical protein
LPGITSNFLTYGLKRLILPSTFALWSVSAFARPFTSQFPVIDRLNEGHSKFYIYGNNPDAAERQSFKLFESRVIDLNEAVRRQISERIQNASVQIRSSAGLGLNSSSDDQAVRYDFAVNGVPFCDVHVKARVVRGLASPLVMGRIPEADVSGLPDRHDWPAQEEALNRVRGYFEGIQGRMKFSLDSSSQCIAIESGVAIPVWKMRVLVDDLPYSALAGEKIFRLNPSYFDVTGMARAYDTNPFDGKLIDYTIGKLVGDGTLTSDVFITDPVGVSRVTNSSHQFVYDVDMPGFDETSVFVHATEAMDWFSSLGFKYSAKKLMKIKPHAIINGDKNNALYTPETSSNGPTILIGDGDGIWLQNLPKDADVVSHEFGHHVIFQTLKEVRGESLVMHEGLADFFTFARTGNACLGESICPVGSPIPCEVMAQCLRTAENDYVYGSADLPVEAHRRSQFISGMLWDLSKDSVVPMKDLTAIVYRALDFFLDDSGYHDLILALLMADRELFESKYGCSIYNVAENRGLGDEISDFQCDGTLPSLTASKSSGSTSASSSGKIKSTGTSSKSGCAVIGNTDLSNSSNFATIFLLILLPLFVVSFQSRRVAGGSVFSYAQSRRISKKF